MGVSIQVLRVLVVARTHSLNAYEPVPERLRKVMTVSEVVNTISSLAHFTQFVNKYLYYMKELNLALKELRNGAEVILLERKDPAYFQHWFEEWWIPLYWNDVENSLDN